MTKVFDRFGQKNARQTFPQCFTPNLAEDTNWVAKEVEATHDLVQLPQQSADVVALEGVRELIASKSYQITISVRGGNIILVAVGRGWRLKNNA